MSLPFPRTEQPVAGSTRMDREWYAWLRRLWVALGFDAAAPRYGDLWCDAHAMHEVGGGSLSVISGDVDGASFAAASTTERWFTARLPNDYRDGTDVSPFLEWAPTDTNTGNCLWSLTLAPAADGETMAAAAALTELSAGPGTANKVERVEFDDVDGDDFVRGTVIAGRIARMGADGTDTYSAASVMFGVGFKYRREGVGAERGHP